MINFLKKVIGKETSDTLKNSLNASLITITLGAVGYLAFGVKPLILFGFFAVALITNGLISNYFHNQIFYNDITSEILKDLSKIETKNVYVKERDEENLNFEMLISLKNFLVGITRVKDKGAKIEYFDKISKKQIFVDENLNDHLFSKVVVYAYEILEKIDKESKQNQPKESLFEKATDLYVELEPPSASTIKSLTSNKDE